MGKAQLPLSMALAAALAILCLLSAEDAKTPRQPDALVPVPVENGGFEVWEPLDPRTAGMDGVKCLKLMPESQRPKAWTPFTEDTRERHMTGTVAMDEGVRRSGQRSVRIENGLMTDICGVSYSTEQFIGNPDDPRNIKPNRYYLLSWWVKGENVKAGTGPIMMMCQMGGKDDKLKRADSYEIGVPLPLGTFDWQRRQFTFITGDDVRWAAFSFQLRWATGTIWYDDITLLDAGPVVKVETY